MALPDRPAPTTPPPVAPGHIPVLLDTALSWLRPRPGGAYVDATTGAGGHASAILEATSPDGRLLALDLDADALGAAAGRLRPYGARVRLVQRSFRDLAAVLAETGFGAPTGIDGILFDLGVSSMQLDRPERGFAIAAEGPLDMRLNPQTGEPAATLVNRLSERELADLIFTNGEEPAARRIARAIIRRRETAPFRTTSELAAVVAGAVARGRGGGRRGQRIHPATRTFQALRIAVNDELGALASALPAAVEALAPGGRIVVIAFHSLEDGLVKRYFRQQAGRCLCPPAAPACRCPAQARLRLLTRKPITPTAAEVAANPRSRSAKLRAAEKLAPPGAS